MINPSSTSNSGKERTPNFWNLLSETDMYNYRLLQAALDAGCTKRNRGHRIEAFDAILDAIKRYTEQNDENDWKRSIVCGICWMDNMIAINTRQLRLLINKCKSSINGSLQKLGFLTNPSHSESWKVLFERIPYLKDNFCELRQWTIRRLETSDRMRYPTLLTTSNLLPLTYQKQPSSQESDQEQQYDQKQCQFVSPVPVQQDQQIEITPPPPLNTPKAPQQRFPPLGFPDNFSPALPYPLKFRMKVEQWKGAQNMMS